MSGADVATTGARTRDVLSVRDLHATFDSEAGTVRAVDGVSLSLAPGEVLAIVGESGSGKTATALAITGLLPAGTGRIVDGSVLLDGEDLVTMHEKRRRAVRGDRVAMVFQDALTALNPVQRVDAQIAEMIRAHRSVSRREARARAAELLALVGIADPDRVAASYVHQLSGGMRQRAMIAMAIALEPDVLIADEPTTALDVTVQAQVIDVLLDLRDRFGTAIVLITHDLGVVARAADRVMVMYGGRVVEDQPVDGLFATPRHPYTIGLLDAMPRIDGARITQIPGGPPSLVAPAEGCRFAPRCPIARPRCVDEAPALVPVTEGVSVACHAARDPAWELPDRGPAR